MNATLDSLFLRRPRLEYVSPAVCEAIFSSTSEPTIILAPMPRLVTPTGPVIGGRGHSFLTWPSYPGQVCFSVYMALDADNPDSPYNLISECIPNGVIALCSRGCFKISANLANGTETAVSDAFCVDGSGYVLAPLPHYPQTVSYNLYKCPEHSTPDGTYGLYWTGFSGNSFEVCAHGCFRVSAITIDGETELSPAVCLDPDCTDTTICIGSEGFNPLLCSCVPCATETPCRIGYYWDTVLCRCNALFGGGGGDAVADKELCRDVEFGDNVLAPGAFSLPCTFSISSGVLPEGLSLNQLDPSLAAIEGTPLDAGNYDFRVRIEDAAAHYGEWRYHYSVLGQVDSAVPAIVVGDAYSYQIDVAGGTGPYTLAITDGTLPTGLTMSSTGLISGTPTEDTLVTLTVQITDSLGQQCETFVTIGNCVSLVANLPAWEFAPVVTTYTTATGSGIGAAGSLHQVGHASGGGGTSCSPDGCQASFTLAKLCSSLSYTHAFQMQFDWTATGKSICTDGAGDHPPVLFINVYKNGVEVGSHLAFLAGSWQYNGTQTPGSQDNYVIVTTVWGTMTINMTIALSQTF